MGRINLTRDKHNNNNEKIWSFPFQILFYTESKAHKHTQHTHSSTEWNKGWMIPRFAPRSTQYSSSTFVHYAYSKWKIYANTFTYSLCEFIYYFWHRLVWRYDCLPHGADSFLLLLPSSFLHFPMDNLLLSVNVVCLSMKHIQCLLSKLVFLSWSESNAIFHFHFIFFPSFASLACGLAFFPLFLHRCLHFGIFFGAVLTPLSHFLTPKIAFCSVAI